MVKVLAGSRDEWGTVFPEVVNVVGYNRLPSGGLGVRGEIGVIFTRIALLGSEILAQGTPAGSNLRVLRLCRASVARWTRASHRP